MMGLELGHGSVGMGRRECDQRSKKVICIKRGNLIWVVKEREEERMTQAIGFSHWVDGGSLVVGPCTKMETIRTVLWISVLETLSFNYLASSWRCVSGT